MIRLFAGPLVALSLVALPALASAADRTIGIGSFDRLRVEGAIEVRVVTGKPPSARLSGDADAIERITVSSDGNTLTVRRNGQAWGETPRRAASAGPVVVTLTTPMLGMATSLAGAKITATRLKATRVDLGVTGSGTIVVDSVDADQLGATAVGTGTIAVAGGRTARARLLVNGIATIDAAAVVAGEVQATLDGPGELKAQARYTATINNLGVGRVTVTGSPKCTVSAKAGGPVACGTGASR